MNRPNSCHYIEVLKELADSDQEMRRGFSSGKAKWDQNIDKTNSNKLEKIISQIGWPLARKVGAQAERCAWLIAQHSPDSKFQRKCLSSMKRGHGKKKFIACLEDRVRVRAKRKQLYGTQFRIGPNNEMEPLPIYNVK